MAPTKHESLLRARRDLLQPDADELGEVLYVQVSQCSYIS